MSAERIAVICGASGGIGRAAARKLAASRSLLLVGRTEAPLETLRREIDAHAEDERQAAPRIETLVAEISDPQVGDLVIQALTSMRGEPDLVVATTATNRPVGGLTSLDIEYMREAFEVKLFGPLRVVQAVAPLMQEEGGVVVMLSGASAHRPTRSSLVISSVNAAVNSAVQAMAAELGPTIRAVAVSPGPVRTERWDAVLHSVAERDGITPEQVEGTMRMALPSQRVSDADEIADVIGFLSSHSARSITGACVLVDGGMSIGVSAPGQL